MAKLLQVMGLDMYIQLITKGESVLRECKEINKNILETIGIAIETHCARLQLILPHFFKGVCICHVFFAQNIYVSNILLFE